MTIACIMSGYCCATAPCLYGTGMNVKQLRLKSEKVGYQESKADSVNDPCSEARRNRVLAFIKA